MCDTGLVYAVMKT